MWKITIVKKWDKIWKPAFLNVWLDIMDESPNTHVFYHPALIKAWIDTYLPIRKLDPLFVLGESGNMKVIFPLVRWTKNWKNCFQRVIVPIGYSDYDYHDPIFSSEVDDEIIGSFYAELFPLLDRYDSLVLDGLHKRFIPEEFSITVEEPCPFIDLSGYSDIGGYLNTLSKTTTKNYLRRKRNLEQSEDVSYITCSNPEEYAQVKDTIDRMLEIHSARWPNAYKAPNFHKNLIENGLKEGVLVIYQIKTATDVIAWRITFLYKNKLMLYMPTINPNYMNFSPGTLSLCYCIEDSLERGIKEIDQLRGGENYKKEWASDHQMIYNCQLNNKSIFSVCKNELRNLLRSIAK